MADIADASTYVPARDTTPSSRQGKPARLWSRIALAGVGILSIFMDFFQLGQNGYGNLYYAAGVRSMADSWHTFFFVSFDPGGFVTIDKPPLGFWLQTLSTKIFGFTPFSIFLPQALCGVLAVLLLYVLVRRHFGEIAGLVAALALALTPITVVTVRNNTIDGTLALALLLAAWAVIHAAETGKLRWLLLSGVFVGLGFNIKMAEAYLVLPALGLTYLLCAPGKLWTRIWHLLVVMLVMLAISFSWATIVDLTPASQRPYVGSTQDNSEISLATGYNGLSRLHIGGNGFGGRNRGNFDRGGTRGSTSGNGAYGAGGYGRGGNTGGNAGSTNQPPASGSTGNTGTTGTGSTQSPFGQGRDGNGNATGRTPQFPGGGGAGAFESGTPGIFRLFSVSLGGQIAWLLPFAIIAIVALACWRRLSLQRDRQQLGLILWGFWLLTMAIFFTLDGSFHQYYMTEMAPGLCAMVGIGLVVMWQQYREGGWRGWFLPLALVLTAVAQIYMLQSYPAWSRVLSPLIGVLTALVVIALILYQFRSRLKMEVQAPQVAGTVVTIGVFALLVAPALWAGYSVIHDTESSFPTAGPTAQSGFAFPGAPDTTRRSDAENSNTAALAGLAGAFFGNESVQVDKKLISYLEAHQGSTKYLLATPSSTTADSIILATNKPVMAMGGFSGADPILTADDLQSLINNGTVRFFLISSPRATEEALDDLPEQIRDVFTGRGAGGFGFGGAGQNALSSWISSHCSAVSSSKWQSSTGSGSLRGQQLYDCASLH